MATFLKLTETNNQPVWVNLDRVNQMSRLPAYEGDVHGWIDDKGDVQEQLIGARPERTRLLFGITSHDDDDFVECLETPDDILAVLDPENARA